MAAVCRGVWKGQEGDIDVDLLFGKKLTIAEAKASKKGTRGNYLSPSFTPLLTPLIKHVNKDSLMDTVGKRTRSKMLALPNYGDLVRILKHWSAIWPWKQRGERTRR